MISNTSTLPPSIISININSLSLTEPGGLTGRKFKVIQLLCHLLTAAMIVCVQDIRIPTDEFINNLKFVAPGYTFHTSASNTRSGGVVTIVNPKVSVDYEVEGNTIYTGSVLATTLKHKHNDFSCCVVNAYLDASSEEAWKSQVAALADTKLPANTILVGDFNHTTEPHDRSGFHRDKSLSACDLFRHMLDTGDFQEVHQPAHTWYGKRGDDVSSSRIDRIYHNFTHYQLTFFTPVAKVCTSLPFTLGKYATDSRDAFDPHLNVRGDDRFIISDFPTLKQGGNHVTDHLPVFVRFQNSTQPSVTFAGKGMVRSSLHKHCFVDEFRDAWSDLQVTDNHWEALSTFKRLIVDLSHKLKNTPSSSSDKSNELWQAIKMAHEISGFVSRPRDIQAIKEAYAHIPDYVKLVDDPKALVNMINEDIAVRKYSSEDNKLRPTSKLETIAAALPSSRQNICCLYDSDTDSITDDPGKMTDIIKSFWGNKWTKGRVHDPKLLFRLYAKKIQVNPTPITDELVMETIMNTNDSAPGPDSIPFLAYRLLKDIAGPIITKCIHGLI